jgi:hypothetical protein
MAKPQRRRPAAPRRAFDFDEIRARHGSVPVATLADQFHVIRQQCSRQRQADSFREIAFYSARWQKF